MHFINKAKNNITSWWGEEVKRNIKIYIIQMSPLPLDFPQLKIDLIHIIMTISTLYPYYNENKNIKVFYHGELIRGGEWCVPHSYRGQ